VIQNQAGESSTLQCLKHTVIDTPFGVIKVVLKLVGYMFDAGVKAAA
jgi:hypothetical protein